MRSIITTAGGVLGGTLLAVFIPSSGRTEEQAAAATQPVAMEGCAVTDRVHRTDQEWQTILGEKAYQILRRQGTEPAFTGVYWDHKTPGVYTCAGCGQVLFSSETKFESGTGWPSFWSPASDTCVATSVDTAHGMRRMEVTCRRCGGHLGHVFEDGPPPTGLRYCINSASLAFEPTKPSPNR